MPQDHLYALLQSARQPTWLRNSTLAGFEISAKCSCQQIVAAHIFMLGKQVIVFNGSSIDRNLRVLRRFPRFSEMLLLWSQGLKKISKIHSYNAKCRVNLKFLQWRARVEIHVLTSRFQLQINLRSLPQRKSSPPSPKYFKRIPLRGREIRAKTARVRAHTTICLQAPQNVGFDENSIRRHNFHFAAARIKRPQDGQKWCNYSSEDSERISSRNTAPRCHIPTDSWTSTDTQNVHYSS